MVAQEQQRQGRYIRTVAQGQNVLPLHWALLEHPELWDQETARTAPKDSPHYGLHDIYIRYSADKPQDYEAHDSSWYPASFLLPVRELIFPLMAYVQGERLGAVLISKVPPGKKVKPHTDGGWHAGYYEKFGIQIASAPGQAFCYKGEQLVTKPGDVFWFDNSQEHWVENESAYDRITMIVCIKRGV